MAKFVIQIFLILFILNTLECFGQNYAPLKNLSNYGIQINNLPGLYKDSLKLIITHPSTITLNTKSTTAPVTLNAKTYVYKIKTTEQIAITFKNSLSKTDTIYIGTYIINANYKLPIVSFYLNRLEFDGATGILSGGLKLKTSEDSGAVVYGRVWKKESIPVFVEYFEFNKDPYAAVLRVKPFGGMTVSMPEKSLRLITDSNIGPKKIKISPFTNKRFSSYKSIVLRTSGNDQALTRIKDITLSSIARDLKIDYQDYRQSILYVNNEYWGIYNLREKINLEYLKYNHNAIKDPQKTIIDITGIYQPEYQKTLSFIIQPFNFKNCIDSINTQIDLENYINYIILQIHIINTDSRGNVRFWKCKNLDNRWRWIFYDSDQSCFSSQVDFNYLKKRISTTEIEWCNPEWATVTLRNLLLHKPIQHYFINSYCLLLATRLQKDTLVHRVDYFAQNIKSEIPKHSLRQNNRFHQNVQFWENQIDQFKIFFKLRESKALQHIKSAFELNGELKPLHVSTNINFIKGFKLRHTSYPLHAVFGQFFSGIPIEFEALTNFAKFKFKYWSIQPNDTSRICKIDVATVSTLQAIFTRKPFSNLKSRIAIDFLYQKISKKDTLILIGLLLKPSIQFDTIRLQLQDDKNVVRFYINSKLNSNNNMVFLTNNLKKAKSVLNTKVTYQLINFTKDFDLFSNNWVLLDAQDQIIDSICGFQAVNNNGKMFGSRNAITGHWPVIKSFNFQRNHENTYPIKYWKSILSICVFIIIFLTFVGIKKKLKTKK